MRVKDDALCDQAWTRNGRVLMKTKKGRIVLVNSLSDLTTQPSDNPNGLDRLLRQTGIINLAPLANRGSARQVEGRLGQSNCEKKNY